MQTDKLTDDVRMTFKGEVYHANLLVGLAKQAPVIYVPFTDMNPTEGFSPTFEPPVPELQAGEVLFYKQEGKYTVLTGAERVATARVDQSSGVKGRLLSGPVLKRIRIDTRVVVTAAEPTTPPYAGSPYPSRATSVRPPYNSRTSSPAFKSTPIRRDFSKS